MSVDVMERARAASTQRHNSLLLLLALADDADDEGVCRLDGETLARRLGLNLGETVELIRSLEAAGELCVILAGDGRGGSQAYVVLPGLGEAALTWVLHERFGFDPDEAGRAARRAIANRIRARYALGRRRGDTRDAKGDVHRVDPGVSKGDTHDPRRGDVDDDKGGIRDHRGDTGDAPAARVDIQDATGGRQGARGDTRHATMGDTQGTRGDMQDTTGAMPGTRGDMQGGRGDIAMSPEPPKEPSKEPSIQPLQEPSEEPPPPYPPPPRGGTARTAGGGGRQR